MQILLRAVAILLISTGGVRMDQKISGDWGGPHVSLQLTADAGTVEFDCAHGELSRAIVLDKNASFIVPGTYVAEHSGPVRMGEPSKGVAVRYAGRGNGTRMTFSVTREDNQSSLGTFVAERGKDPTLTKCR